MKDDARITELEQLIKKHQNLYYNGKAELSDGEFDLLWDELVKLDPQNAVLQTVGKDTADGFPKELHILPMGSQAKAADSEEFLSWCLKNPLKEYIVEFKMDGASLELQYKNGKLDKAITRGDGNIGDDITPNAIKMHGFPLTIPGFSGAVRGEVVMSKQVHKEFFSDKANCRNAANGLMKRKDGNGVEKLDVVFYDAASLEMYSDTFDNKASSDLLFPELQNTDNENVFLDEVKKMEWLKKNGFYTAELKIFSSPKEVIEYRSQIAISRDKLKYDIDGLVIKCRNVDTTDMKRARPENQIAFKFPLEEAEAILTDIEWSESGASYTPVGIITPVHLAGTTVKRASLANPGIIRDMGLCIGSKVVVVKRGEIIPKIDGLLENPSNVKEIVVPSKCTCGATLIDENTRLYCPNPECPKKALHRLEKWLSVLDILEFGTTILKKLFDSGKVKTIADLYTLTVEELASYERMGEASASKIIKNLQAKSTVTLAEFIAGFDIEGLGLVLLEKLTTGPFSTLEKLRNATSSEIASVDGFALTLATRLKEGLAFLSEQMDKVLSSGKIKIAQATKEGNLSGLSFCFTGELVSMKRAEAQKLVKSLGGQVSASVVKNLSYLVTNDTSSGSSKNLKAQSYGIKIISEDEFISLCNTK